VINHVSWLDIAAVHAVCPRARFVSKADVRHWPLLGWLIAAVGTLFIERERKRDALRVVHQMAGSACARRHRGDLSGRHDRRRPDAAGLFTPICCRRRSRNATPVQPVMLRYTQAGSRGESGRGLARHDNVAQSIWAIACAEAIEVAGRPTERAR